MQPKGLDKSISRALKARKVLLTIYTYVQKVTKCVRVALNNFGDNVRVLRSLIIF